MSVNLELLGEEPDEVCCGPTHWFRGLRFRAVTLSCQTQGSGWEPVASVGLTESLASHTVPALFGNRKI